MTSPASVGGDEQLRLFLAVRLPERVLDAIAAWQDDRLPGGGGARAVRRDDLHVTLAFLGHRSAGELEGILGALREAAAAASPEIRLTPSRYAETRSVGMLVLDDEEGRGGVLAADLQARLERLGVYRSERRPWLPHVTVARFRARPRLQPGLPAVRTFVPSDAAAYLSRLRPSGAQYDVLESVALGG